MTVLSHVDLFTPQFPVVPWDHHPGRGFRAELFPISGSLTLWPFQTPGVLPRWCWLFLPSLVLFGSLFDTFLVWWTGSHQISPLIFSVAVLYPLSSLAALWESGPLCWKSHLQSRAANAKVSPFFSPCCWLNLCSPRCERCAAWFIGLILFVRMFAEGFAVSGHPVGNFFCSVVVIWCSVFLGAAYSVPVLFLIAGDCFSQKMREPGREQPCWASFVVLNSFYSFTYCTLPSQPFSTPV